MTIPKNLDLFNKIDVAVPNFIRHPTLKKLAERVQHETLGALTIQANCETQNTPYSTRVLDSLYQTPIADASVLVAITNERRPKLLLTRRAAHMTSHAGEVSCAGGKHEIGDGNNVVTALREACEETALSPSKVQLLGQLPTQTSLSGMSVRPIVALIAPDLLLTPEVGEISRIFWADFETLITQPMVDYVIDYPRTGGRGVPNSTLVTPSWQIEGEVVWGLTGRVLASLLELGFDRKLEWYYHVQDPQC